MRHRVTGAGLTLVLVLSGLGAGVSDSRVADAAKERHSAVARALIKQGLDPNVPQRDGATALHWAAHWNDVSLAKTLIAAGALVTAANDYGVTPLFLAATNGSAEMLSVLLGAGANANAALPAGETVLMTAVRSGNIAAVRRLLAAGANPNAAQRSKGQTALMWAAGDGQLDIARALIEAGAEITKVSIGGSTPLMFAAREGHLDTARMLVAAGDPINAAARDGSTPLLNATVRGHAKLAMTLLELGAAPDGDSQTAGFTPLMWAVSTLESMQITYKGFETDGEWATFTGIPDREQKVALVKALLARGAEINAKNRKALPRPAGHQGDRNISPHLGSTPFLIAAHSADAEMMRLLLANGADPSARAGRSTNSWGAAGETALLAATDGFIENTLLLTEDKRIAAMQVALDAGNDIEAYDEMGRRAMHVAARSGFHEIVKFLVEKGAEKNSLAKADSNGLFELPAQSPLGLVEGTRENGFVLESRPETAAFLRTLGFVSIGRLTQDSLIPTKGAPFDPAAGQTPSRAVPDPPATPQARD